MDHKDKDNIKTNTIKMIYNNTIHKINNVELKRCNSHNNN